MRIVENGALLFSPAPAGRTLMLDHPDRSLGLSGASNFRDLGGYAGTGGRPVRWRRLFRSDHLAALTPEDARTFQQLGVTRTFDFRGTGERAAVPYDLPGVTQHALPIEPTVVQRMKDLLDAGETVTPAHTVELMQHTYRAFVHDNATRFRALFSHLLESDAPLVFHCTAGKDRTGFASALILHALGVADEVIAEDYLLTNRHYKRDPSNAADLPADVLDAIGSVEASYLAAAFEAVGSEYGDLETYLRDGLKLGTAERTALQERYLQA